MRWTTPSGATCGDRCRPSIAVEPTDEHDLAASTVEPEIEAVAGAGGARGHAAAGRSRHRHPGRRSRGADLPAPGGSVGGRCRRGRGRSGRRLDHRAGRSVARRRAVIAHITVLPSAEASAPSPSPASSPASAANSRPSPARRSGRPRPRVLGTAYCPYCASAARPASDRGPAVHPLSSADRSFARSKVAGWCS